MHVGNIQVVILGINSLGGTGKEKESGGNGTEARLPTFPPARFSPLHPPCTPSLPFLALLPLPPSLTVTPDNVSLILGLQPHRPMSLDLGVGGRVEEVFHVREGDRLT